ncbi:MAG: GNVR domain-containing protein [Polyangiales bacterium]
MSEEKKESAGVTPDNERMTRANVGRLLRKHGSLVVACVLAVVAVTFFWTLGQPRIYRSEALLRFDPNPPKPLGNRVELVSDSTSWWNRREFYETELRVVRSTRVSSATVRQLGLQADSGFMGAKGPIKPIPILDAAHVLSGRLSVEPVKDSSLVYIRYEDYDPGRAQRVLATHVRIYLDQNLEQTTALSTTALEWLNDQLGSLKDDLEKSERALSDFRLKNNVLSLSLEDRHNLITTQLESVIKEITTLEIRRIELAARSSELNAAKQEDPLSATTPDLLSNEILTSYRTAYGSYLKDIAELSTMLGDNHPKVLALRAKLDATKTSIENEVKNIKTAAASELRSVDKRLAELHRKDDELQKQAHELQQFEVPFNQLTRTKNYSEKIYGLVLERARETNLTRMMNFNNVRVVEDASLPGSHYRPQLSQNVGIGAILGLVLGLALAAARELSDQSLRTPNEVETMLNVTCLGFVPEIADTDLPPRGEGESDVRDTFVAHRPDSPIAEAVRVIRTNLTFMAPDRPYRTVVVTSALPEEGKTTVSCSLALTLAQSGLRVVLVDSDLRRPRLHRTFGMSNDVGVTLAVGAYAAGFRITAVSLPFVGDLSMGIFALPVTTIWIVGIVNAINLIDGLDGLAAGVTFFAGITGLVVAKISGTPFTALMMATMLGAVLGFLFFNFNPARIFMGDSGSYFLGFVLAATSLVGSAQKTSAAVSILVPILALGVPILDTLFSIVRRFLERRSIFSPDRGHIHHRLLDMGITHRRAVFILYGFSFAFTAAAIAVSIGRQWQAGVAILGAAAGMLGIVRFVGYFEHLHLVRRQRARIRTRHTDTLRRVVPKLALALQEAETEDEVLRLFDEHLEDAEVVCCDIVRREGDDVERAWASPRFSSNRMVEYVSARFPLTEASSFDARFRWLSEFGEVSPQTEILLQLAVDLVISALQRTSSRYVPAPMQVAREERSFALAQRTGSV